jgi:hypothetical protein
MYHFPKKRFVTFSNCIPFINLRSWVSPWKVVQLHNSWYPCSTNFFSHHVQGLKAAMKPEWLKGQLIQMYEAALYYIFYKFCFQNLQAKFWNKPKTFTLQNSWENSWYNPKQNHTMSNRMIIKGVRAIFVSTSHQEFSISMESTSTVQLPMMWGGSSRKKMKSGPSGSLTLICACGWRKLHRWLRHQKVRNN